MLSSWQPHHVVQIHKCFREWLLFHHQGSGMTWYHKPDDGDGNILWNVGVFGPPKAADSLRFYLTRRFITMFTRAFPWVLLGTLWIQSTLWCLISVWQVLILSSPTRVFPAISYNAPCSSSHKWAFMLPLGEILYSVLTEARALCY
jgi:hypothetical protein